MKTLEEHIDDVMDWFDFEKVHLVMTALDWTWASSYDVPDVPALRKEVRRLMRSLWESNNEFISSGGFTVRLCREENWARFSVSFQVADWDSED